MGGEMKEKRRAALRDALKILNSASVIVERACDEEQDAVDNYPENLQSTEKFEKMEDAVDNLNEAASKIDEAKEYIGLAIK